MNILIYTVAMDQGVERLMPWRMILEVAKVMQKQGHKVLIASASKALSDGKREYQNVKIVNISSSKNTLKEYIETEKVEVLFYPLAYRDGIKSFSDFKSLSIKKIGYFPGGIYSFRGACALFQAAGVLSARPYFQEIFTPRSILLNNIRSAGFSSLIALSDFTAQKTIAAGWNRKDIFISLPGHNSSDINECDPEVKQKYNLDGCKYYLFAGAPSPIRGSLCLLKAFDRWADQQPDACLVMLMRKDTHTSFEEFEKHVARVRNRDKLIVIYGTLSLPQLMSFVEGAYAVVLPFLLVPSEIPLTFFEVLSCGVPVITFSNGGTYRYLKKAVMASSTRTINSLTRMINELWYDQKKRDLLSSEAKSLMESHPAWEDTAQTWINCLNK